MKKKKIWVYLLTPPILVMLTLFYNKGLNSTIFLFNTSSIYFICLAFIAFCLGMFFKKSSIKVTLFCFVAVFAALTVGEVYMQGRIIKLKEEYTSKVNEESFATQDGPIIHIDDARALFDAYGIKTSADAITAPYMNAYHEKLGYRLTTEAKEVLAVKLNSDDLIYMAQYHLNSDGWRVTPQNPDAKEAVVILGDSFAFGLGLNDEDTYAYKVGTSLGEDYQVFNFGVPGWGTHQVLALIEDGWLDAIYEQYDRVHVFYMPIDDHLNRITGEVFWEENGPCYQLQEDGTVKFMGSFKSVKENQQNESLILSQLNDNSSKQKLMKAMIRQADNTLKEKYNSELTLIRLFSGCEFLADLSNEGIDIISEDLESTELYKIPYDGHLNALGSDVYAKQIVDYINGN